MSPIRDSCLVSVNLAIATKCINKSNNFFHNLASLDKYIFCRLALIINLKDKITNPLYCIFIGS